MSFIRALANARSTSTDAREEYFRYVRHCESGKSMILPPIKFNPLSFNDLSPDQVFDPRVESACVESSIVNVGLRKFDPPYNPESAREVHCAFSMPPLEEEDVNIYYNKYRKYAFDYLNSFGDSLDFEYEYNITKPFNFRLTGDRDIDTKLFLLKSFVYMCKYDYSVVDRSDKLNQMFALSSFVFDIRGMYSTMNGENFIRLQYNNFKPYFDGLYNFSRQCMTQEETSFSYDGSASTYQVLPIYCDALNYNSVLAGSEYTYTDVDDIDVADNRVEFVNKISKLFHNINVDNVRLLYTTIENMYLDDSINNEDVNCPVRAHINSLYSMLPSFFKEQYSHVNFKMELYLEELILNLKQQGLFSIDMNVNFNFDNILCWIDSTISSIKESISNFLNISSEFLYNTLVVCVNITVLCLISYLIYHNPKKFLYLIGFITIIKCTIKVAAHLQSEVNECLRNLEASLSVAMQSGEKGEDDLNAVIIPLVTAMCLCVGNFKPDAKNLKELCKNISYVPRAAMGVEKIVDSVAAIFKYFRVLYYKKIHGVVPVDIDGDNLLLDSFLSRTKAIVDKFKVQGSEMTDYWFSEVQKSLIECSRLLLAKEYKSYHSKLLFAHKQLTNILEIEKNKGYNMGGPRPQPVLLYLFGQTGQGKSSMAYPLSVDLLRLLLPEEDLKNAEKAKNYKNQVYSRNPDQEYWDGYHNQFVTVYDDWGQLKDSQSNPSLEYLECIRTANIYPFPLHMATLDDKANTYFTSKIMIMSSNLPKPQISSLHSHDALVRRMVLPVRVSVDGKYCKEIKSQSGAGNILTIDIEKVKKDLGPGFHKEIYVFEKYTMLPNGELGDLETITYNDLIKEIVTLYKHYSDFNTHLTSYLDTRMTAEYSEFELEMRGLVHQQGLFNWNIFNEGSAISLYEKLADTIEDLSSSWYAKGKDIVSQFKDPLLTFLKYFAVFLPITLAGFKLAGWLFPKEQKEETLDLKQNYVQEMYTPRVPKQKNLIQEVYTPKISQTKFRVEGLRQPDLASFTPIQQVSADSNALDLVHKLHRSNMYTIGVEGISEDGKFHTTRFGFALALYSNRFLIPEHFHRYIYKYGQLLPKGKVIIYRSKIEGENVHQVRYESLISDVLNTVIVSKDGTKVEDFCIITISSAPFHKNIIKHFCSASEISNISSGNCVMPLYDNKNLSLFFHTGVFRVESQRFGLSVEQGQIIQQYNAGWFHNVNTNDGDCGSPMVAINKNISHGKILGIHVLGNAPAGGYSVLITQQMLHRLLGEDIVETEDKEELIFDEETSKYLYQIGGVAKRKVVAAGKSQIEPSVLCDTYEPHKTEPTLLHTTDKFNPVLYRLEKHKRNLGCLSDVIISQCAESYFDFLASCIAEESRLNLDLFEGIKSQYNIKESIEGIDGCPYVTPIHRGTSPGYPWMLEKPKGLAGKRGWFGCDGPFDYSQPVTKDLLKHLCDYDKKLIHSIKPDTYYVGTLKDERKEISKKHKTRLFMASSMDYSILFRRYFMGFQSLIARTRNRTGIAIGTNPYSGDWHMLANLLRSVENGKNLIAGDFEGADSSHFPQISSRVVEIVNKICTLFLNCDDKDNKCRRLLFIDLYNPLVLVENALFQFDHSLASGNPGTACFNSIYFDLLLMYCYVILTKKHPSQYFKEVSRIFYGDDHILSVVSNLKDVFNLKTIQQCLKDLGVGYTDIEKKTEFEHLFYDLNNVTFIKRRFRLCNESLKFVAPLDIDTILETPQWVKKGVDSRQATIDNVEWALKELSLHEKETWDLWFPKLRKACLNDLKYNPEFSTQDAYRYSIENSEMWNYGEHSTV